MMEEGPQALGKIVDYSYDSSLVLISCLIAMFAGIAAFHLLIRVNSTLSTRTSAIWLVTSTCCLGSGIWSMHFIGMLAVRMPGPVHYDITLTGLSILLALSASGVAFNLVSKNERTLARVIGGGLVLGGGIGAMHYTGMAAMRMAAIIRYDPVYFAASLLAAVLLACFSLHLLFRSLEPTILPRQIVKTAGGCAMGLSIAAMHYIAMGATDFVVTGPQIAKGLAVNTSTLGVMIASVAFLIVSLGLLATFIVRVDARSNELRHSKDFLANVLTNTADAVIAIGQTGLIQLYNPAAEQLFGYTYSEIIGKNVSILLPPDERNAHDEYLRLSDFQKSKMLGLRRFLLGRTKDGRTLDMQISLSAMQTNEGKMFIGICHDKTEEKRVERDLQESKRALQERVDDLEAAKRTLERQETDLRRVTEHLSLAREEAEAANHAKSSFLATMSHELRTPLNAVIGFSEMMGKQIFGPLGDSRYTAYAAHIQDAGVHLLSVISDILDLSKIEAGEEELFEESLDVGQALGAVLQLMEAQAEKTGVKLETDLPDTLPVLWADATKVKQILFNLISNAIKFTEPGGKVSIKAWLNETSGFVAQITDTGIGIAAEDVPKALSPFQQVNQNSEHAHEGTGIGLSLAKRLAELHGGSLDLQSQLNVGTTVTVRFPKDRVSVEPTGITQESAS